MTKFASLSTVRKSYLVATLVVMLALLAVAGATQASTFEGHLPGKTWTTNGAYTPLHWVSGWNKQGYSICTTAAEYSGGWSFPYGWTCGGESDVFTGSGGAYGYPAVDNPNSREFTFAVEYF